MSGILFISDGEIMTNARARIHKNQQAERERVKALMSELAQEVSEAMALELIELVEKAKVEGKKNAAQWFAQIHGCCIVDTSEYSSLRRDYLLCDQRTREGRAFSMRYEDAHRSLESLKRHGFLIGKYE